VCGSLHYGRMATGLAALILLEPGMGIVPFSKYKVGRAK
jgi:hypothetical protein